MCQSLLHKIPGEVLCFSTMFIFGSFSLFLRAFPEIPIIGFLFAFQVVGTLGFAGLLLWSGSQKISRRAWILLGALVVSALGNDLGYFFALRLTTVANAAVAHHMESIFILFLAPFFIGEKTKGNEYISLAVTLIGIGLLYYDNVGAGGVNNSLGVTLALMSAFFLGLLIVLYRMLQKENLLVVTINFWRHFLSTLVMLPAIFFVDLAPYASYKNLAVLAVFGILFAVIASGLHNFSIGRTRAVRVGLIGKTEPIIAVILAFFFLSETPGLNSIIGGTLIISATTWLILTREQAE